MTEWGVFGVIAAIISFGVCIGAPLLRLNSTITRLSVVLDIFQKQVDCDKKANNEEHVAIWDTVEKQGETLNEHEIEIQLIKQRGA